MWVRNAWYVAGWSHDLPPGIIQSRTICNEPIVLYRKSNGTPVVFEDRCCHRLAPLSKGRLEGDDLRCMYHGLKFAPDGRCIEIPGQVNIPAKAAVKSYPVVEHGSWIWVWPGDAARADVSLLPETIATSDADWQIETGFLDYAAHYQLINDNLLDLSHLSFVHAKTLGRGTPQWANQRPNIIPLPRGVRFQRWFENRLPAHYMAGRGDAFDMWHSYDFLVPGLFIQRPAWYPTGTAQRMGFNPPTEPPLFVRCDDQAVIPETANTSRYYYAVGARSIDTDAATVHDMFTFTQTAFYEDKDIIEAQQKVIALDPSHSMLSTSLDAGPNLFRGIVKQLLSLEASPNEQQQI